LTRRAQAREYLRGYERMAVAGLTGGRSSLREIGVNMVKRIEDLPHALTHGDELAARLDGKNPAVFLDYDGTLTPIVERPEDAIISSSMRNAVRDLAERCPVCVVSGRDRRVVQELMGVESLIVAGSHGFDIWSPAGGSIQREMGAEFGGLLDEVKERLHEALDPIEGALVEPKKASVAAHYRLVGEPERSKVREVVERILADHKEELKMTPGKMVYEIQPKIDWDKGKAVLYLIEALGLDRDDVVPMYLGDDITDEHAFRALEERGIGIFVGCSDDPELLGRRTAADYILNTIEEVEQFLDMLAR
jgi:trehalose 6-phosphate phosphatase